MYLSNGVIKEIFPFYRGQLHVCLLYQVACNQIVIDFFLSRPTDPVPSRDPPDGAAGDKANKNITADDGDDNNGDDVLFSR